MGRRIRPANRHDMVFTRAINIDRQIDLAQIDLLAAHRQLAGLDQVVLMVGIAQVPGVHGTGQVGGIAVPVQQIERRRRFAFQIIAHHVVPHQIVGPQKREGGSQVATLHQAALPQLFLAVLNEGFVDEQIQNAGVLEIKQRGKQRSAGYRLLAFGRQHSQRRGQNSAADAEAQCVDGFGAGDLLHHVDGFDRGLLDVVIPSLRAQGGIRVAPTHDEGAMALRHGVTNQRVLGLQVQNIELVDARRNQQKRLLVDLGGERLVLDQLKQLVLKHHRAFSGGNVFADFKLAFVRHRHMALGQVVHHVFDAFRNALALGFDGLLLRVGVEGQKVAGRCGCQPLLNRKADARLRFGVGHYSVSKAHQGTRVQQIDRS